MMILNCGKIRLNLLQNIALDFDGFAKKLITELKSINAKLDQVVS